MYIAPHIAKRSRIIQYCCSIVVTMIAVICSAGMCYQWQIGRSQSKILQQLELRRSELAPIELRLAPLQQLNEQLTDQCATLEQKFAQHDRRVMLLLLHLAQAVPHDVIVQSLECTKGSCVIQGIAQQVTSVHLLMQNLSHTPDNYQIELHQLHKQSAQASVAPYTFTFLVRL